MASRREWSEAASRISELERREQQLEAQLRLRASEMRAQQALMDRMLEELRRSLGVLSESLVELRHERLDADATRTFGTHIERIEGMVQDVEYLSAIERGGLTLDRSLQEFVLIGSSACDDIDGLLRARAQTLQVDIPDIGLKVDADRQYLAMALAKILHNASKFSAPHARIQLSAFRSGGQVLCRVTDTGIGIPPHMLEAVAGGSTSESSLPVFSPTGLGVGLRIARAIVELHGGTLTISSAGIDRGSEVTLALPTVAG